MKKIFFPMIAIWLAASLLTACEQEQASADKGYQTASVQEAHQAWLQKDNDSFVFLDVRTPREYADGHIPDAVNIPVQSLSEHLKDIPQGKKLYVYCESGVRASKASKLLVTSGFKQVYNFKASMRGWRNASYPIEK